MSVRRWGVSFLSAFFILSGCGSGFSPPYGSGRGPGLEGGLFVAHDIGISRYTVCRTGKLGHFTFHGTGRAAYMQNSSEDGNLIERPQGGRCLWSGKARMTSSDHPENSIVFALSLKDGYQYFPCRTGAKFDIIGGTGEFRHARGSGTIFFDCDGSVYTDAWSGTVTF